MHYDTDIAQQVHLFVIVICSAAVSEELGDDALSVPVLEVTDRPKNNLWIIASEDPDLPNRLMTAVLHGPSFFLYFISLGDTIML